MGGGHDEDGSGGGCGVFKVVTGTPIPTLDGGADGTTGVPIPTLDGAAEEGGADGTTGVPIPTLNGGAEGGGVDVGNIS